MLFHALLPCMIFVLLMQGDDTNILTKELGYLKTIWWSYSVQRKKWAVINKTDTKKKRIFCVNCHFSPGHHQSSHVCLNKEEFSFLPNSSFFALFVIHCVARPVCMKVAAVSTGSFFENNNNRQQQQVQHLDLYAEFYFVLSHFSHPEMLLLLFVTCSSTAPHRVHKGLCTPV